VTAKPWPRVAGANLLPAALALAEDTSQRVGFFGGSPATHDLLAEHVREHYPTLQVSGMWAPGSDDIETSSNALAAAIRAARTDILIVSLGKPRQEEWVDRYGHATGTQIYLPCGGAVDFLAGKTSRAPHWMQRFGLEWFYRLTREPRRLARRYLLRALAVNELFGLVLASWRLRRECGYRTPVLFLLRVLAPTGASIAVVLLLSGHHVVLTLVAAAVAYLSVSLAIGPVKWSTLTSLYRKEVVT
jgi:exopolysaccharide biosynthesis WecB/TagA/CpsF family protein